MSALRRYPSGGAFPGFLAASTAANRPRPRECASFTAWTTGVSNPFRSPRFHPSASGQGQRSAFASGVPPAVVPFHRSRGNSERPSLPQERRSPPPAQASSAGKGGTGTFRLRILYTQSILCTRPRRLTATAGTAVGRDSPRAPLILQGRTPLYGRNLLHGCDIAGSGLRPLPKILDCCPPMGSGPCLSARVADLPLRTAWDRRLGTPFPPQLPIPRTAHRTANAPVARGRSSASPEGEGTRDSDPKGPCPPPYGRSLCAFAPVRHGEDFKGNPLLAFLRTTCMSQTCRQYSRWARTKPPCLMPKPPLPRRRGG